MFIKSKIELRIESLLRELDFETVIVNGIQMYTRSEEYYKITFIEQFQSYVIEYASNFEDAKKNIFEDGDLYPVSIGEDELINSLRSDLLQYYI